MKARREDPISSIIEGVGRKPTVSAQVVELLNHALRLEYAGVTHLPRLDSALQQVFLRYGVTVLSNDATAHAVRLAATIRELGGTPTWTVWTQPENGSVIRLLEIQLARERICHNLYAKAARLLCDSPLGDRCDAMAQDEDRHIDMVERMLTMLMEKEGLKPAPAQVPHEHAPGVLLANTASTS